MTEEDYTDWAVITTMQEVGVDPDASLRGYFARKHLKIDRYKVFTDDQESEFQRWLTADADIAAKVAAWKEAL